MKVYLDYNSTTPLLGEVIIKIKESLTSFGNPSSLHQFGVEVKREINIAREKFSSPLNKSPNEFIFTSSATESNNMILKGIFLNNLSKRKKTHIITSTIEHPSIINTCKYLEKKGVEISYIPVDNEGFINIEELKKNIKPETSIISIMYANNEIGTIQPISKIGEIAKEHNIPFHTDAAQAFMKVDIDMKKDNIDFLTVAGHKIGAPKGIGALFFNTNKIHYIDPLLVGGHQENDLRGSTENVIHILAFAEAVYTLHKNHSEKINKMKYLTNKLQEAIEKNIQNIKFNGTTNLDKRLPNTLNYSFLGLEAQSIMLQLDAVGIAVSTGSACSAANMDASYVLLAIGDSEDLAFSSIRMSTGWQTTEEEINYVINKLTEVINLLKT